MSTTPNRITEKLKHRKEISQRDELIGRLADYLETECDVKLEAVLGGWEFDHATECLAEYAADQAEYQRMLNHDPDFKRSKNDALREDAYDAHREAAREAFDQEFGR